jgi:hypothetical protein
MKYLSVTFLSILFCAIVCLAQVPEPTPILPGLIEYNQRQRIEQDKKDVESDELRVRAYRMAEVVDDTYLIGVQLTAYNNKINERPSFEILLGVTEKQIGGNEEFFKDVMRSQPANSPKMTVDILPQPLNFKLIQSSFSVGGIDDIVHYFRDEAYRINLKDKQIDRFLNANSIDFTCGNHQFSITSDDLEKMKQFINHEMKITNLSWLRKKSKPQN